MSKTFGISLMLKISSDGKWEFEGRTLKFIDFHIIDKNNILSFNFIIGKYAISLAFFNMND